MSKSIFFKKSRFNHSTFRWANFSMNYLTDEDANAMDSSVTRWQDYFSNIWPFLRLTFYTIIFAKVD